MKRIGGSAAPATWPCTASAALHALHKVLLDALALADGDDGLLPVRTVPDTPSKSAGLARNVDHVHREHVHLERVGDRVGDVALRRALRHREGVPTAVGLAHRTFGDHRTDEDRVSFDAHSARSTVATVARAASASSAGRRTRTVSARRTSARRSVPGVRMSISLRFAVARPTRSSVCAVTSTARPVWPTRASHSTTSRARALSPSN